MSIYIQKGPSTAAGSQISSIAESFESIPAEQLAENTLVFPSGTVVALDTHYIDANNNLVEYTAQQKAKRQQLPGYHAVWSLDTMSWRDLRNVQEVAQEKLLQINQERERRNWLPVQYSGSTFDADQVSQRNIQNWIGVIGAGGALPSNFQWRDANNVNHPATAEWLLGLNAVIVARTSQLYAASWQKKQTLETFTDFKIRDFDVLSDYVLVNGTQQPNWPGVLPS
jgi:hypothetical protein